MVSQSYQIAPFDMAYNITDESAYTINPNFPRQAKRNDYTGSPYQQAVSVKVNTTDDSYQCKDYGGKTQRCDSPVQFDQYGYEYNPGASENSYITWSVSQQATATLRARALAPDTAVEIDQRSIAEEPMYIVVNLGVASSFSYVSWDSLTFPAIMLVDYIRVWQDEDKINLGCNPEKFPTSEYIARNPEIYSNQNLTSFLGDRRDGGFGGTFPGNKMLGQC